MDAEEGSVGTGGEKRPKLSDQEALPTPNPGDTVVTYQDNVLSKFVNDSGETAKFEDLLGISKLLAILEPDDTFKQLVESFGSDGKSDSTAEGDPPGAKGDDPSSSAGGEIRNVDRDLTASQDPSMRRTELDGDRDRDVATREKDALSKRVFVSKKVPFIAAPTIVRDHDFWRITSFGVEDLDVHGFERTEEKLNFLANLVSEVMVACEPAITLDLNTFGSTVQTGYPDVLYVSDSDKVRMNVTTFEAPVGGPFLATVGPIVPVGVMIVGLNPLPFDPAVPGYNPFLLSHTHLANGVRHKVINVVERSEYVIRCRDLLERRYQGPIGVTPALLNTIRYPLVGYLDTIYNPRVIRNIYTRVGDVDAYNRESLKAFRFERVQLTVTPNIFSGLMDMAVNVELGKEARALSYSVVKASLSSEISPSVRGSSASLSGEDQSLMSVISPSSAHAGIIALSAWCAGGSNMTLGINPDDVLLTDLDNVLAPVAAFAFLRMTPVSYMDPVDYRRVFSVMMKAILSDDDANNFTDALLGSGYAVRTHYDAAALAPNHTARYNAVVGRFPIGMVGGVVGGMNMVNATLRFINLTAGRGLRRLPVAARMFSATRAGGIIDNQLVVRGGAVGHTPFLPFTPDAPVANVFTADILGLRMGAEGSNIRYIHDNNHATNEIRRMRQDVSDFFNYMLFNLSARLANMHRRRKGDLSSFFASYMRAGQVNSILSAGIVNYAVTSAFNNADALPPFDQAIYALDPNIENGEVIRLDMSYALSFLLLGVGVESAQQQYKNSLIIRQPSVLPMYYKLENYAAVRVLSNLVANPIGQKVLTKCIHIREDKIEECLMYQAMVQTLKKLMTPQPGYQRRLAYYRRRFLENIALALPAGGIGMAAIRVARAGAMVPLTPAEYISLEAGQDRVILAPPRYYNGKENFAVVTFIKPVVPYALTPSFDAFGVADLTRVMVHGVDPARNDPWPTYLTDAHVAVIDAYVGSLVDAANLRMHLLGVAVPPNPIRPTLAGLAAFEPPFGRAAAARLGMSEAGDRQLILPFTAVRIVHDHLSGGGRGIAFGVDDIDTEGKLIDALKALRLTYKRLSDVYTDVGTPPVVADPRDILTILSTTIVGCSLTDSPGVKECFVPVALTRLEVSAQTTKSLPAPTLKMKGHSGVIESVVSSVPLVYYTVGRSDPLPRFIKVHTIPMSPHLERVIIRDDAAVDNRYDFPRRLGYLLGTRDAAYNKVTEMIEVYKREGEDILDGRALFDKVGVFTKHADGVA